MLHFPMLSQCGVAPLGRFVFLTKTLYGRSHCMNPEYSGFDIMCPCILLTAKGAIGVRTLTIQGSQDLAASHAPVSAPAWQYQLESSIPPTTDLPLIADAS